MSHPLPALPDGWLVESTLTAADETAATADLVVAVTRDDVAVLDLLLVDVSGHGSSATARATAFESVLRRVVADTDSAEVMAAANDALHDQDRGEGFATAVHLSVDLTTGDYALRGAGHPPAVRRKAASGRWRLLSCQGPILGLLPGATYDALTDRLESGDALLLYTDGVVERPRRDLERGIVGMVRAAEDECRRGFDGFTTRLMETIGGADDDRALLLVHRR